MNIKLVSEVLLKNSILVCWPPWGSGNALTRIMAAHDEFSYNLNWNAWGPGLPSSILPPPTLEPIKADIRNHEEQYVYSIAHMASPWGSLEDYHDTTSFYQALEKAVEMRIKDYNWRQWFKEWNQDRKKIILPVSCHLTAETMLGITALPKIQLCFSSLQTLINRQEYLSANQYGRFSATKAIQDPSIHNILIEDLFWADFETFSKTYQQLRKFCEIQNDREEQIWAFVLYYRDRIIRTSHRDVGKKFGDRSKYLEKRSTSNIEANRT